MNDDMHKQRFAEKLKSALENNGYEARASVLEREFNLHHFGKDIILHAAAKWLRGEAIPRYDKIMTLSKWLKVPPEELVYGVKMKQKDVSSDRRWEKNIGYQERALFELFLNLPVPQRTIIREIIIVFNKVYGNKN